MSKGNFSLGQAIIAKQPCHCVLLDYTAPSGGGNITKTRAEILADAIAKLGLTAPTGYAFDLQCATIATYSKGTTVTDFTSQAEDITTQNLASNVTCNASVSNVNPFGGNKKYGNDVYDEDCNGDSDNLLADDFAVEVEEGSAVAIYACITPVFPSGEGEGEG